MQDPGRAVIRWAVAIIVLAAVVAYAIQEIPNAFQAGIAFVDEEDEEPTLDDVDGGEDAEEAADLPTGPVEAGATTPDVDFSVNDGLVNRAVGDELFIGPDGDDSVVLSFPLIEGDPNCVEGVRLELEIRSATPTELGAHPSALFDAGAVEDGSPPPGDLMLNPDPSALAFTNGTPGRLPWDVTGMYRTWATGAAFGEDRQAPVGTPFVVAVRATDGGAPGRAVEFGSVESGDQAPTLTWTGVAGCGEEEGNDGEDVTQG
jgi:hypothetical protein